MSDLNSSGTIACNEVKLSHGTYVQTNPTVAGIQIGSDPGGNCSMQYARLGASGSSCVDFTETGFDERARIIYDHQNGVLSLISN